MDYELVTIRQNLIGCPQNKPKRDHTRPTGFGLLRVSKGQKARMVRILFDSGATGSFIDKQHTKRLRVRNTTQNIWQTGNGKVSTCKKVKTHLILPELYHERVIEHDFNVLEHPLGYDVIMGTDLMSSLGININFEQGEIQWQDAAMPFKSCDATAETAFHIEDTDAIKASFSRIEGILDAHYEKANLDELVARECEHLSYDEQILLRRLLRKHESLFDGQLGHWKNEEYNLELKPGAVPYHARAYPIPKIHEQTLRKEVDRLCHIGVLRKVNRSEWAAPTFIIPKKDGSVRFISDFRELNKRLKRKPFPIPKIQDLLLKLEGFQYATSLDLNMGYYHIELSPFSRELCTIVLPWGKYEYQRLPMGLANSPDIFQEKINSLMGDLEFVRSYIDDCLVLTSGSWEDHLKKLDEVLTRLQKAGLKVNATKSFFGRSELEYLGYWITRDGIQPLPKKVAALQNIAAPRTRKELRSFIGMVNYYRDMWVHRSDALAPLAALTSKNVKWEWKPEHQLAFEQTKKIISREVMLTYPDFNQPFIIHTDASHLQLGAVISQNGKPIAFYSRKLNPAQTRYTTTERELLAIVETLKEFRNILLGQQVTVYTDHLNLTHKNFNVERVMRWRLILEEFGLDLQYTKGETNIVADALSRLPITESPDESSIPTTYAMLHASNANFFGMEKAQTTSDDSFPLTLSKINQAQKADKSLLRLVQSSDQYALRTFRRGETSFELIVRFDKIVIPKSLQSRTVEWYHYYLCHPGETRTEQTIRQHFWWNNLRDTVHTVCKTCDTCQRTKKTNMKYGHLPEKTAQAEPWDVLCIDLIGPYTINRKNKKKNPLVLWAMTMIDPATGWFEICEIKTKSADVIANILEVIWLSRYPWPAQLIFDRGSEFKAEVQDLVTKDYGIKRKPISVRNPQANAIIERIHQTIGNMIRTFEVYDNDSLDDQDPWTGILAAVMAAVRSTYSTTTQATPSQLVFRRDAILNIPYAADWDYIRQRKQDIIHTNNVRENAKRKPYRYQVGTKVLVALPPHQKFGGPEYEGPYVIAAVKDNGTLTIRKNAFFDNINIRQVKPYFD